MKGWHYERYRHSLAAKGIRTGRKIVLTAHDYIEFIEHYKRYSVPTKYDKYVDGEDKWKKDVAFIERAPLRSLQERGIEQINPDGSLVQKYTKKTAIFLRRKAKDIKTRVQPSISEISGGSISEEMKKIERKKKEIEGAKGVFNPYRNF